MHAGRPSHNPTAAKLVERQMRNWELARAQRLSVPAPQREEVEDFIAISRNAGVQGKVVAAELGERLGWPVFGREILDVMAGNDDLRRQIYASMDERDLSWYEETLRALMQPEFVKNDYFNRLTETVLSLARQGHAVFLGRGADFILPRTIGFRVRLVAPFELCAEDFAKRHNLTPERARVEVARLEQERSEFIRNHFQIDPADPTRHDLTINMERFTLKQTVELILSARTATGMARY